MPTRSASRAFAAPPSIPCRTRRPMPRPQALADRENLSDTLAGIEIKRRPRGRRHSGRPHPPRDAHLSRCALPLAGRRTVDRRRADQQSASFGRLQGAEGAGRAVGAGRTRLSVQRQGRGAAARPGVARQGGRPHRQRCAFAPFAAAPRRQAAAPAVAALQQWQTCACRRCRAQALPDAQSWFNRHVTEQALSLRCRILPTSAAT